MKRWSSLTCIGFRFAFVYLGLYSLVSHVLVYMFVLPNTLPGQGLGTLSAAFDATQWVAIHVFGMQERLVYTGNSRDTNFFWVQLFLVTAVAVIATAAWSFLDRRPRTEDVTLQK